MTASEVQKKIRLSAMNLLARREHSKRELLQKLLRKEFSADDIQPVLEKLSSEKLLNEQRFVENYIHFRSNKGFGPQRIRLELTERGISESDIREFLEADQHFWQEQALKVWKKRFKNKLPTDFKTRAQQMRFLQYRGFTAEQIERIFS